MLKAIAKFLAFCFLSVFTLAVFAAPPYSKVIVFGDSLSDIGNNRDGQEDQAPVIDKIPDGNGGFKTGEMWIQVFVRDLKAQGLLTANATVITSRTIDDLNSYDPNANYDFAYSGDQSGGYDSDDREAFYYHAPDGQSYACRLSPTLGGHNGICSVYNRAVNYDASWPADPNALYIIWVGANDINNQLGQQLQQKIFNGEIIDPDASPDVHTVKTILRTATNTGMAISHLAHNGAKNFMIINLPNLGYTPQGYQLVDIYNYYHPGRAQDVEKLFTNLTNGFNKQLNTILNNVQFHLPNISIVRPNVSQLFDIARSGQIAAFPSSSFAVNVNEVIPWMDNCCFTGGGKLPDYEPSACIPDNAYKDYCDNSHSAKMPENKGHFLFLNAIHPTACVHRYMAKYFESYLPGGKPFNPAIDLCTDI